MISYPRVSDECQLIVKGRIEKSLEVRISEVLKEIPDTDVIPTEQSGKWLQVEDAICVYVDMKNSTLVSSVFQSANDRSAMPSLYTLFTGTAVRLFRHYQASYIDVKGDGVFALFNASQVHRALAAAVTFKTFVELDFKRVARQRADHITATKAETGAHIGIHQSNLLVSKVGLKRDESRSDMHNEVWAGEAVNYSSKLAGLRPDSNEIIISSRFFNNITAEAAKKTCGCSSSLFSLGGSKKLDIWQPIYDLPLHIGNVLGVAYSTDYAWCQKCGEKTSKAFARADGQSIRADNHAIAV